MHHLTDALVDRERHALARFEGEHNPLAVDALWEWLASELRRGDIRVLLELGSYRGAKVQAATREASTRRHAAADETIARLFRILELKPRIETSLLANVVVAFIDGLAIGSHVERGDSSPHAPAHAGGAVVPTTSRIAFDVFWLAMLSLAE